MKKVHSLKIAQSIKLKCYQFTWQNGEGCLNTSDVSNSPDKVDIGFSTQEPRFKDKIWTASWLKKKKKTGKKILGQSSERQDKLKPPSFPFPILLFPKMLPSPSVPPPAQLYFHWVSAGTSGSHYCRAPLRMSVLQGFTCWKADSQLVLKWQNFPDTSCTSCPVWCHLYQRAMLMLMPPASLAELWA